MWAARSHATAAHSGPTWPEPRAVSSEVEVIAGSRSHCTRILTAAFGACESIGVGTGTKATDGTAKALAPNRNLIRQHYSLGTMIQMMIAAITTAITTAIRV